MIHCRWHKFSFAFGLFDCVLLNFGKYKSKVIFFRISELGCSIFIYLFLMSQINQYVRIDFCLFSVALLSLSFKAFVFSNWSRYQYEFSKMQRKDEARGLLLARQPQGKYSLWFTHCHHGEHPTRQKHCSCWREEIILQGLSWKPHIECFAAAIVVRQAHLGHAEFHLSPNTYRNVHTYAHTVY